MTKKFYRIEGILEGKDEYPDCVFNWIAGGCVAESEDIAFIFKILDALLI
jgi:hypothetical protein